MGKLLLDEKPLFVLPSLAEKIGLNEAIILQQLHYWLEISENEFEGRKWVYNSYKEWQQQFPWWKDYKTIERIFKNLEKVGLILSQQINKANWDRRKWYSIDYEILAKIEKGEFCPFEWGNFTHSNGATSPDREGQLQPIEEGEDPPVINTEITPENTTEITAEAAGEASSSPDISEEAKPDCFEIESVFTSLHGLIKASPVDIAKIKYALQITRGNKEIILSTMRDRHDKYKPQYEGDKIRAFSYYIPAIQHENALQSARAKPVSVIEVPEVKVTPEQKVKLEQQSQEIKDLIKNMAPSLKAGDG